MRRLYLLVFIICFGVRADEEKTYHVLFVGNSLTFVNYLPLLVETYAQSKGISIDADNISKAGYAIADHWSDGEVQQRIQSRKYDYVIIQQGPSSYQDGLDMLVNDGKLYKDLCEANDAQLVYYMVWPSIPRYRRFDYVIDNYTAGAKANDAILSPVGKVWKEYIDSTGDYSYYGPDGFHPSLAGSQVAAEVIVDSIFASEVHVANIRQAWLTGVGQIKGNTIHVSEMLVTENGGFGEGLNPDEINSLNWGELSLEFDSCNTATMRFASELETQSGPFESGEHSLQRVARNHQVQECEDKGFQNVSDKSFFSGTFYGGPERDGEGIMIDYLNENQAIVSWFTYLPIVE